MKETGSPGLVASAELVAIFTAVLAIPFYLGIVHWPVPQMLLYSGAASATMTTGGFLDESKRFAAGLKVFFFEMLLWLAIIIPLGGLAYLIALIF